MKEESRQFTAICRGDISEQYFSSVLHQQQNAHPILISSKLLRSQGCGQIDLASLVSSAVSSVIHVIEVKNNGTPSATQLERLKKSCNYLAHCLDGLDVRPWLLKKILPNTFRFFNLFLE